MNITDDELKLLNNIKLKIQEKPEFLNYILTSMIQWVNSKISEYKEMAADMETVASIAVQMAGEKRVSPKTKQYFENLAMSKLQKYNNKSFSNWEWAFKKGEE